jgi:exopolysaccharide production protein ExoZ
MVALFHFQTSFVIGAAGVDIFFVVSGFIMGYRGVQERPKEFLINRLIRIVPLYWLFTLVMCAASLVGVFSRFTFDAESLFKSLFFIPYFDATGNIWPLMVVGWTLNVEIFFYAVFAAGLAVAAPIAFTSIALAIMVIAGQLVQTESATFELWSIPIVLEFVAGLLLARFPINSLRLGILMAILGVLGFVAAGVLQLNDNSYRLFAWGIPALLLVGGCLAIERAGKWPGRMGPLILLGNASYSLYLTHGLVAAATHKVLPAGPVSVILGLSAAIAVAIAVYYIIEVPTLAFLRRHLRKRQAA